MNSLRWAGMGALLLCARPLASSSDAAPSAQPFLAQGHQLYYAGFPKEALAAYQKALEAEPGSAEAYLNGAVVAAEEGLNALSAQWFRKASELQPKDPDIHAALGEAEFRRGNLEPAREALARALESDPRHPYALLTQGRVRLALGENAAALELLARAAESAPHLSLAYYWLGKAKEAAQDAPGAAEAYHQAAEADSYFTFVNNDLERLKMHKRRARTARASEEAPRDAYRLRKGPTPPRLIAFSKGRIPLLRVGIGTSVMGEPLPRKSLRFNCRSPFQLLDGSGRQLLRGEAQEVWELRLSKDPSRPLELLDPEGKLRLRTAKTLRLRPDLKHGDITVLREKLPGPQADPGGETSRPLRGELEFSPIPDKRGFKIVNVVDLESYTHGVLAAEMPILSPMEALKAQAVVARTHALYMKSVMRRHLKDDYDLCDGQHCQVYKGVTIESERSRAVVSATQGRVVAHQGRQAHVLYSANCGGHTQSGREVKGWGDIAYWQGVPDAPPSVAIPDSPWSLRRWLRSLPPAYCRPSVHAHASNFRWASWVPADELGRRIDRLLHTGEILQIRTLKRSASGHLNTIQLRGSNRSVLITSEIRIRGLLGIGSQRSTLFTLETEFDADGKPRAFLFHGGGWGHGVGMCQSGAMGRAEEGYSYVDILKAYYPDTELGDLRY